jgi:hypothetical protein
LTFAGDILLLNAGHKESWKQDIRASYLCRLQSTVTDLTALAFYDTPKEKQLFVGGKQLAVFAWSWGKETKAESLKMKAVSEEETREEGNRKTMSEEGQTSEKKKKTRDDTASNEAKMEETGLTAKAVGDEKTVDVHKVSELPSYAGHPCHWPYRDGEIWSSDE